MNPGKKSMVSIVLITIVTVFFGAVYAVETDRLRLINTIALPDVKGRIDHMALDQATNRLFVAALGNDAVEVIDLGSGKSIHSIRRLKEPQGVLAIPEQHLLFIASGGDGTLKVFNEESLAPVKTVQFSADADNIRYDRQEGHLYVGYGEGAIGIVDAKNLEPVGDIPLPGHPESFQLEKRGGRMFVNVPSAGKIVVVDRAKKSTIAEWLVPGSCSNFPMALDEEGKRLLVGCRHPAKIIVYDTATGKQVSEFAIAGDADDIYTDSVRKRIYVSCGAGVLQIFEQTSGTYAPVGNIQTGPGARTSFFGPEQSRLYVALPRSGNKSAEIRVFSPQP